MYVRGFVQQIFPLINRKPEKFGRYILVPPPPLSSLRMTLRECITVVSLFGTQNKEFKLAEFVKLLKIFWFYFLGDVESLPHLLFMALATSVEFCHFPTEGGIIEFRDNLHFQTLKNIKSHIFRVEGWGISMLRVGMLPWATH